MMFAANSFGALRPRIPSLPQLGGVALGAVSLGAVLLGGTLLAPAARAQIIPTGGPLSLGTTVNGCGSGPCSIGGGKSRGKNLFHRLDRFDTSSFSPNDRVDVLNGSHRTVVMGVIGPLPTRVTVPVTMQNKAGLMLMSPAGISVSGRGSFENVSRLGLTSQTQLKVGASWFDAVSTTAQELDAPDYAEAIGFGRGSLRTWEISPGSIEITGAQLVVERNLLSDLPTSEEPPPPPTVLIDSGLADLSLNNAVIRANDRRSSSTPNPLAGEASLALYGRAITLSNSQLEATGNSQLASGLVATADGLLNLQADKDLTLTNSTLKGLKIGLRGESVALYGAIKPDGTTTTLVTAPRGVIQVETANRITLEGSTLDVAPKTAADVLGQGLGLLFEDTGTNTRVFNSTSALISLATTGAGSGSPEQGAAIQITNASINASNLVAGLEQGILEANKNPQDMMAGDVFISSSSGLSIAGSNIFADADQDYAGQISLLALDSQSILALENSTIQADAPNGSGDITLFGTGPVLISGSTLEANTTEADFNYLFPYYNPSGEIKISSQTSINVNDIRVGAGSDDLRASILRSTYSFKEQPTSPYSTVLDKLDQTDSFYLDPPGGLIRLSSRGSISITGGTTLDVSSSTGVGGTLELLAAGGSGTTIAGSVLLASVGGPLPDAISSFFGGAAPLPYEGLKAGRIDIAAENGIRISDAVLDTSLNNVTQRFDLDSGDFVPMISRINLLSGSGETATLSLRDSSLLASAPLGISDPYFSQGGTIVAASQGTIEALNLTVNVDGDAPGTFIERPNSPGELAALNSERKGGGSALSLIDTEAGSSANKPQSVLQLETINTIYNPTDPLTNRTIIIINRGNSIIDVVGIGQNLNTTQTNITEATKTIDISTEAGLKELETFLKELKIQNDSIAGIVNSLDKAIRQQNSPSQLATTQLSLQNSLAATPTTAGGAMANASTQTGATALATSLAMLAPLSEAQTTASLQDGEEASRDRLAEYLGDSASAPPVPTLASLQQLLRQASAASSGGTAEPAAILRLSYSEDPQALGQVPNPGGWQDGDLLAQASTAGAGAGSLDLVLVTSEGQPLGWRTSIQLTVLRNLLRAYYSNLAEQNLAMAATAPAADAAERRLFELLFRAPLQQLTQQRVGTLIISADPSLIDIPWNALHDGDRYLSQRFALAVTPSLAFTNLAAAARSAGSGGQRMNAGASLFNNGLMPLPMVEKELAELSGQRGQGPVTTLLNRDFNPTSFSSGFAAAGTRQVHIASHAEIAAGPQRIPTIYTGDTALSLRELGKLRQRSGSGNLDLVTLSACRSALNGADLELGFAGLAVQLGAKTAIGTKWYVDDLATSSFFVLFYRQLEQGLAKAEALRATQQAFAGGQVRVEGTRVIGPGGSVLLADLPESYQHRYTRGFSHPYYWAGVQLVGSPW